MTNPGAMAGRSADTIFALASAPGRAGVAVIRASGPDALALAAAMAGTMPEPRRAVLRSLRHPDGGQAIDQGLVLTMPGPGSFTGEDCVEFHVHGGRAVVAAMLAALGSFPNCRLAEPGEFARRAFAAGKLDLAQVEGLADLIDAETEAQRVQALRQAGGEMSARVEDFRSRLITAMALVEAAIDFSDEGDVAGDAVAQARGMAAGLRAGIAAHLTDGRRGEVLRRGFHVVLAGPVNAGKSSLLNWLAKREAAITSQEPGTTRDLIEVRLDLDGLPVVVVDTAGVRETDSAVEREGIRRGRLAMAEADLVLWLRPADLSDQAAGEIPAGAVVVETKIDLVPGQIGGARAISVATGAGLAKFMDDLVARVAERIGDIAEPAITQERHRAHLAAALEHIEAFLAAEAEGIELAAERLRLAAGEIGRITGRVDVEDVLDQVFGRFCIGK